MMRWPCEYFFRYMHIDGNNLVDAAHMYGFPAPDAEYVARVGALVTEDRPSPLRFGTVEADHWLREQRVFAFYETPYPTGLDRALKVLGDPCLRPTLETLLLTTLSPAEISQYFEAATGLPLMLESLRLYQHFFWNRRLLSDYQWREFLAVTKYPDYQRLLTVLVTPPEVALWHLGFRLHLDRSKAIASIFDSVVIRSMEAAVAPVGQSNSITVRNYSEVAFAAAQYLSEAEDITEQHTQLQKAIKLRWQRLHAPALTALSNGHHSNVLALPVKAGSNEPSTI